MEDYQKRVLVEQKELGNKIVALTEFLNDIEKSRCLSEQDFNLMNRQLEIMLEYNRVLQMRIFNF